MKPRLLDGCCGPGGAAKGYQRAGFYVVGVDIKPQPHYCGDEFIQADFLEVLDDLVAWRDDPLLLAVAPFWDPRRFAAIHASPPCDVCVPLARWRGVQEDHPDLLATTIARLRALGLPWVVENVPEAATEPGVVLCGSSFGLSVRRHRWFLTEPPLFGLMSPCRHSELLPFEHKGERAYADAMGCEWMSSIEAREAVPPAFTEFIGAQLMASLRVAS